MKVFAVMTRIEKLPQEKKKKNCQKIRLLPKKIQETIIKKSSNKN